MSFLFLFFKDFSRIQAPNQHRDHYRYHYTIHILPSFRFSHSDSNSAILNPIPRSRIQSRDPGSSTRAKCRYSESFSAIFRYSMPFFAILRRARNPRITYRGNWREILRPGGGRSVRFMMRIGVAFISSPCYSGFYCAKMLCR